MARGIAQLLSGGSARPEGAAREHIAHFLGGFLAFIQAHRAEQLHQLVMHQGALLISEAAMILQGRAETVFYKAA